MNRFLVHILALNLCVWILLPASAPAEDRAAASENAAPEETAGPRPKTIIREKTLYVPYEKLEDIFEKEGRGVFLPYKEFLELWQATLPEPPEPEPPEPPSDAVIRAASYVGRVSGEAAVLEATYRIEALKKDWSEIALPLRNVAVESIELSSPGALIVAGREGYTLLLPEAGHYEAKLKLAVRVTREPGKKSLGFAIPPTALSRLELTIPEKGARIQVEPEGAVSHITSADDTSKLVVFLGNSTSVNVSWLPPAGRVQETGALLVARQSIHTFLGARVLETSTIVDYNILRGEEDTFRVRLPSGMRLLAVKGENIREWSQENETLIVSLHSAVKESYRLDLRFERILPDTPQSLTVPFPQAEGVLRESGNIVLGYESGIHVRIANATGPLSQLDPDEVPPSLRKYLGVGFEYLAHPVSLELQVEKILPVVRAESVTVITLGKEEDAWIGWIDYSISKAGLFRVELRVPERWNVASVGAPNTVEDYQISDADANGRRVITVSLKKKELGNFRLPFRLTAEGSIQQAGERTLGPPEVLGVDQDRGLFGVSVPRAYDLLTAGRQRLLDADVDDLFRAGIMSQLGADAGMPRAYRYRSQPATVRIRIEAKSTEIEVLAQHLVRVEDGSIKTTHILDYNILYAAVDSLRFSAPSTLENVPEKVEAENKKEVKEVSSDQVTTVWELTLQAPTLGSVTVTLNHEVELKALESGTPVDQVIPMVQAIAARIHGFVAVEKKGTLEIVTATENMESIDPSELPDKLRRGSIYSAFRYIAQRPALTLTLTHYEYETLATTIVNLLHVKSVLSEDNKLKSQATLIVQNTERQYLEVRLAPGAEIFSLTVQGRAQPPNKKLKDTDHRLIPIPRSAGRGGSYPVVIVYDEPLGDTSLGSFGSVNLTSLEIVGNVPVAKVEVDLYLPPEYAYLWWGGNLGRPTSTGLWPYFKRFVSLFTDTTDVVGRPAVAAPREPRPDPQPEAISLHLPTGALKPIRLETLAPVGTLRFTYVGRRLFTFLDLITFLGSVGGGYYLVARRRFSRLKVTCALIALPLVAAWFTTSAIAEIYNSCFAGGVVLGLLLVTMAAVDQFKEYRASRRRLPPDPYLEGTTSEDLEEPAPQAISEGAGAAREATVPGDAKDTTSGSGPDRGPEKSALIEAPAAPEPPGGTAAPEEAAPEAAVPSKTGRAKTGASRKKTKTSKKTTKTKVPDRRKGTKTPPTDAGNPTGSEED